MLDSAIPFVRIDLNKAAPGTTVTLASTEPEKDTKDLVVEFVTAFNTLRSALNRASISGTDIASAGALAGESSIRTMKNELSRLTTTQLASSGAYKSLNDIGIKTNQDGTLSLDTAKLDAAIAADAGAVARMIKPPVSSESDPGLAVAVENIRDRLKGDSGPLTAAKKRYDAVQTDLRKQLEKLDEDMTAYEERLTVVYSRMAQQLNAFKATQSYLEQQVALWNNSKDN
ncbi:MAG: flagellar filament capping protein FliD [Pseudomonadota bacterium]|nr:flagellar filament capping protein FliD [Pseudomonadota bacterium]